MAIYFLKNGSAGFVLSQKYNNLKFVDFPEGCFFGIVDIIGSVLGDVCEIRNNEADVAAIEDWMSFKDRLKY